jgi:TRAP-type C4-dicarboxylate transport system permease small subunit
VPDPDANRRSGLAGAVARAVEVWALLGGVLLLAVVGMNVLSVLGGVLWRPFPGDFELTEVGVAVAVFAFLPWCQLTGANVTADIFTSRAGPRAVAGMGLLASVVALIFAGLLLWRMTLGLQDQRLYAYTTTIVQLPIWWAFVPILVSLALLVAASAVTLAEKARAIRRGGHG